MSFSSCVKIWLESEKRYVPVFESPMQPDIIGDTVIRNRWFEAESGAVIWICFVLPFDSDLNEYPAMECVLTIDGRVQFQWQLARSNKYAGRVQRVRVVYVSDVDRTPGKGCQEAQQLRLVANTFEEDVLNQSSDASSTPCIDRMVVDDDSVSDRGFGISESAPTAERLGEIKFELRKIRFKYGQIHGKCSKVIKKELSTPLSDKNIAEKTHRIHFEPVKKSMSLNPDPLPVRSRGPGASHKFFYRSKDQLDKDHDLVLSSCSPDDHALLPPWDTLLADYRPPADHRLVVIYENAALADRMALDY